MLKSFRNRLFILMFLLGVLLTFQFRALNSEYKYTSMKDMYAHSIELEVQKSELEQLNQKKSDLLSKINDYKLASVSQGTNLEGILQSEIDNAMIISGLTEVEGPGVVIIVADGTRALNEFEDPNRVLIHDLDIRAMVDDLRNAGAEAIAINGQRVIFNKSKIQCVGPTIKINDQVYAPPYIISAIGDRKYLESAINAPGSYGESLRTWGVFIEVNTSVSVSIPAYEGGMTYQYILNE